MTEEVPCPKELDCFVPRNDGELSLRAKRGSLDLLSFRLISDEIISLRLGIFLTKPINIGL